MLIFLIAMTSFHCGEPEKEKKKDPVLEGNPGVTPDFPIIPELMKVG